MGILNLRRREFSDEKWVVFDFDGTIAETSKQVVSFFNEHIVPHFGCPSIVQEDIEKLRDLSVMGKMKYLNISVHKLPSIIRRARKDFRGALTDLPVVNGIVEQLDMLQESGYKLAIISSNRKKNIQEYLHVHNIKFFKTIFCDKGRSLFVKHKTIKKFLKTHRIPVSQMVYIGDEGRDVSACKRIRVPVIGVAWGWDSHKRLSIVANEDEIIDTPDKLFPKVVSILGQSQ